MAFVNEGSIGAKLFWLSPDDDDERFVVEVGPHLIHHETTYSGHVFKLKSLGADASEKEVAIKSSGRLIFRISKEEGLVVESHGAVLSPSGDARAARSAAFEAHAGAQRALCEQIFNGYEEDAAHFCNSSFDSRHYIQSPLRHSEEVWRMEFDMQTEQREERNYEQPKQLPHFTNVGFQVAAIPEDLYKLLQDFYAATRLKSRPEDHGVFDPNLSGRQSDTWLSPVPGRLEKRLTNTLRPILASWTGHKEEDLEKTAIYGLRLYHNGSILHMHVDRKETHVISAILEVGHLLMKDQTTQTNWPLRIFDHSGQEHLIPNSPGQMILYESSTCPHGRPNPFVGREMANIFVHFKPWGWPKASSQHRKPQECGSGLAGQEGSCNYS